MDLSAHQIDVIVRLAIAVAAGMAIGIEREMQEQAAGLRTHILVCVGSCLFTLVGVYGFQHLGGGTANPEPTRIASNIVTGVGFLGAGAILREGLSVRGLTTAASLWVVAAIGMAVAVGMYFATGVAVVFAVASLWLLRPFRRWIRRLGEKLEVEEEPD